MELLKWEDRIRSHPFYARAAIRAVQIYVLLYDQAQAPHGSLVNGDVTGDEQSANERKKALKKAKKEQQKKEKAEAAQAQDAQASATAKGAPKAPHKVEIDPSGTHLAQTAEPLKDAMKFLQPLLEFCSDMIEVQIVGFEIFFRRSTSANFQMSTLLNVN